MTPTNAQILARLEAANARIELYRFVKENWRDSYWQCFITLEHNDTTLNSRHNGISLDEAIADAWAKISPIVDTLAFAKTFELPLLTLDATANATPSID